MPKIVNDEQVYNAAMQMVVERGYAGATAKQIAEAAGISEVTLFRKYSSKAELVKQAIMVLTEKVDLQTAAYYSGDVTADLLRVVQAYQAAAEKYGQFFYLILSEIPRYPELAEMLDTPFTMMEHVGQLLARYQAEGVLMEEPPMHGVAGLLGPLISINVIRAASPAAPLPPLDLSAHVARYLNGRIQPPTFS